MFNKSVMVVVLLSLSACKESSDTSDVKYLLFGMKAMVQYANEREVAICTNSPERAEDIRTSALMWFRAIKTQTPNVTVVSSDPRCVATVTFESLGSSPSYAMVSDRPDIHMNQDSTWYNSNETLVHEFGHAFGLKDTYSPTSRKAGDCQDGQPQQAVMCTPQYGAPQPDDIAGVREVYGSNDGSNPDFSQLSNGQDQIGTTQPGFPTNSTNPTNQNYQPPGAIGGGMPPVDVFAGAIQALVQGFNPADAVNGVRLDPRVRIGDGYCEKGLRTRTFQDADAFARGEGKNLAIVSALPARTVTVCLGEPEYCGSPHAFRLLAESRGTLSSGGSQFLVKFGARDAESLRSRQNQKDKAAPPMVTIEGILSSPDGRQVRMGCLSTVE